MLPLGHDATRIMPSAMLGAGCRIIVSANATAGQQHRMRQQADQRAARRGDDALEVRDRMSSATPNSTNARMTSSATSDSGLKCSRTASSLVHLPLGSRCMSLKCMRPGAHMCLTGSTST